MRGIYGERGGWDDRRRAARSGWLSAPGRRSRDASGACCATKSAGQTGIPAGIDATIAGVASVEGSGAGSVATTGASRMVEGSRVLSTPSVVASPATAISPAAMAA